MKKDLIETVKEIKRTWLSKLLDIDDRSVSSTNVYVFIITIMGLILLLPIPFVLFFEIYFNHQINSDLSGLAAYIGAVSTFFVSAGVTKAWTSWTDFKSGLRQESFCKEKENEEQQIFEENKYEEEFTPIE